MNEKMRSCVMGLLLGQFSSPLPMAQTPEQKEPVAYLYNGVRLPALPEWDKETYPDLVLFVSTSSVDGSTIYVADALAEAPVVKRERNVRFEYYLRLVTVENTGYAYFGNYNPNQDDDTWMSPPMVSDSGYTGRQIATLTGANAPSYELLWSASDIYYADDYYDEELAGTLYHKADHEPIPVYE